jgi:anti-sigma factor RsiW
MNCKDVRENLVELLAEGQADPAVATHVKECVACAQEVEALRRTMALLDEWEAPEPSPYFLTRLRAHVREEQQTQPERGWLTWIRKPALAVSMAAVLVAGGAVYQFYASWQIVPPVAGTAVGDLESLDKNHDLFVNSNLLEDLTGGPSTDVME